MSSLHKEDYSPVVKLTSLSSMTPAAASKSKSKKAPHVLDEAGDGMDSRSSTPVSGISNGPSVGSMRPRSARIAAGGGRRSRQFSPPPIIKKTRRIMTDLVDDAECELGLEAVDETEWHSESNDEADLEDEDEPELVNDEFDQLPDESVSLACSEGTDNTSVVSGLAKTVLPRRPKTPDFIFDDVDIPKLDLPDSSTDLLLTGSNLMTAFGIYEVLRRFRAIVRLSPFRFEDLCAAIVSGNGDDQSVLLVDVHMAILRALLREDDCNNTTFGPYDTKDSVAIAMHFVDPMTWYECTRSYLDSDTASTEFRSGLSALTHVSYSNAEASERLNLLRILTDLFLGTNAVRQELASEGDIPHDDHCRACHKLGDLLCCDWCTAVYHLACVETPLEEVPEDEWICSVCKTQQVKGVTDCTSEVEKSGFLCRHEPIGYDRHCRKYYFICRRIVVEGETDSDVWYYSTKLQLQDLLEHLDGEKFERDLVSALEEIKEDIDKQISLTEELTQESKAGKKSELDSINEILLKKFSERAEQEKLKELEDESIKEDGSGDNNGIDGLQPSETAEPDAEMMVTTEANSSSAAVTASSLSASIETSSCEIVNTDVTSTDVGDSESLTNSLEANPIKPTLPPPRKMLMVMNKDGTKTVMTIVSSNSSAFSKPNSATPSQDLSTYSADGRKIVTRSRTGSLTPKQFADSVTATTGSLKAAVRASMEEHEINRIARNRAAVTPSTCQYTGLFKLGLEGTYKHYVNQYTSNSLALNKHQHNEEREKRRHLSHKFSLSPASDFTWSGSIYGSQQTLINTLRASIIQLESRIPLSFLHPNWSLHRTRWLKMVNACRTPEDFGGVLAIFEACVKPVVFQQVWHEALGHTRLHRTPFLDREETRKKERQDTRKKKLDEEEENVFKSSLTWVKYSLGVKHQVWKQRGEEYRITGNGGWVWVSVTRPFRIVPASSVGLRLVAAKLHARRLKRQNNSENGDVDVLECKEPNDIIKGSSTDECFLDDVTDDSKQELLTSKSVKMESDSVTEESAESEGKKNMDTVPLKDAPNDVKTELPNEKPEEDCTKIKEEDALSVDLMKSTRDEDQINANVVFGEDFSISESLMSRTAYPRVTKPYSRLDHLLDRRTAQWQVEQKQRALCEQLVARYRSQQESDRKRAASVLDMAPTVCSLGITTSSATLNTRQPAATSVSTSLPAISSDDSKQMCYSSLCRADVDNSALSCYSSLCRQRDKSTCDASSVTLSNDLCDSGVEDNDELDKITDDLSKDVTEGDSNEVKSLSGSDVNGDHDIDQVHGKGIKNEATNVPCEGIVTPASKPAEIDKANKILKGDNSKLLADSNLRSKNGRVADKLAPGVNLSNAKRPVSPTLSLQKYTQDGRIHLTAALVEEFEAKLAIFGRTCYKVSLSKRTGPGRPPTKTVTPGAFKTSVHQKKLPPVQRFRGHRGGSRTLFALERYVLNSLARREGKRECPGFNYGCKMNNVGWPYPCPRPYFRTAWRYRMQTVRSVSGAAVQLRILWACIRWDDLNARVPSMGASTVTTEYDITTKELLKRRDVPPYGLRSEYLVRKIVVPINVPVAQPREKYTPQRSGLRERRRAESPKQKEPTVSEVWLPEEQLELWQIKQFTEKLEKQKAFEQEQLQKQKLKQQVEANAANAIVGSKSLSSLNGGSNAEVVAKLEEQLKQQRLAMAQKRLGAEAQLKNPLGLTTTPLPSPITARLQTTDIRPKLLAGSFKESPRTLLPLTSVVRSSAPTVVTLSSTPTSGIRVLQTNNGQIQIQPGQQIMRLPDGRQYLLTMGAPKSQSSQLIQASAPIISKPMVLGQKVLLPAKPSASQYIVSGQPPSAPKPVFVLGSTPAIGRPRLLSSAQQQQSSIIRMSSGQQIMLRSIVPRPAAIAGATQLSTPRNVNVLTDSGSIQPVGLNFLNSPTSPSLDPSSAYSVTPQVVQQVLSQALLQTQSPDIQAKLLAMQKQMQLSGVQPYVSSDDLFVGRMTTASLPARSTAVSSNESYMSRLTSEQKEEQTRTAACVQVMRSLLDSIERKERVELKRQRKQETIEEKRRRVAHQRLETLLLKHKEALKRDILRKRALLEKEIAAEIQAEISQAVALQPNMNTVSSASSPVKKRKLDSVQPFVEPPTAVPAKVPHVTSPVKATKAPGKKPGRKPKHLTSPRDDATASAVTSGNNRTTYEQDTQLYCVCKTPYDESKFYIGCDRCEDWFHGSCVGLTKCEADRMDSYVCPACRQKSSSGKKSASPDDVPLQRHHLNELQKVVASLQSHKMGWPFLKPVSASEVPDYYVIIKEPMDLQTILSKVNRRQYTRVNDFVKDMTKMFDNCRYYNAPNSPFYRCAEVLEVFFVEKIKQFKAKF